MIDLKGNNVKELTLDSIALTGIGNRSQFMVTYTLSTEDGLSLGPVATYGLESRPEVDEALNNLVGALEEALADVFGVAEPKDTTELPRGIVDIEEI